MTATTQFEVTVQPDERETALLVKEDVDRGMASLGKKEADPAISAFKIALAKVPPASPIHDVITHNLMTAYRMRINQLLDANEPLHVNRYLPEASALRLTSPLAKDVGFRSKFADTMRNLSLDFYNARQYEASLFFVRKAIAVEPCPSYYIDLVNSIAWLKTTARLSDYTSAYKEADLGRHIFITCAPKSGSTFLKNVLAGVTGFRDTFTVYASLQNEQELDLPHFQKFGNINTVTQQHARASEANVQMMQAFGVRPVVLVRNIYDTAASLLDFYTQGFTFSTFFDKEEFASFDQDQKLDLLIEYVLPWFFQFYASWQRAERDGRLEMLWITYEEMIADKKALVRRVLEFYGIKAAPLKIAEQIVKTEAQAEKNRFNVGVAGRGKVVLSDEQRERIRRLGRHFPSIDFGLIGL